MTTTNTDFLSQSSFSQANVSFAVGLQTVLERSLRRGRLRDRDNFCDAQRPGRIAAQGGHVTYLQAEDWEQSDKCSVLFDCLTHMNEQIRLCDAVEGDQFVVDCRNCNWLRRT